MKVYSYCKTGYTIQFVIYKHFEVILFFPYMANAELRYATEFGSYTSGPFY